MKLGCGRPWNGDHIVEGEPLRCGTKLYTKADKQKTSVLEVNLCPECEEKATQ